MNGPSHDLPQAGEFVLVVEVLAAFLQVFLVDFGEGGELGGELLDFEFVALSFGVEEGFVLKFEVVGVGLGGVGGESQLGLEIVELSVLFLQLPFHDQL